MKQACFYLILLLLSGTVVSPAQIDVASISSVIDQAFKQSPIKGLAVGITNKDGMLLSKTLGQQIGKPLDGDTPLWLGSVSKTLTALAICRLVDLDQLVLDAPINTYLQEDQQFEYGASITVKDLLHHHSGISQEAGYTKDIEYDGLYKNVHLVTPPGEKGIYSSANYAILGHIIENVSGKSYAQFMNNDVFTPLGMLNTEVPSVEEGSAKQGYCLAYGLPLLADQMNYGRHIIPAGYIISSLEDVNTYCQFLLGNGTISRDGNTEAYLQKETLTSLFTPYDSGTYGYGKSWGIGTTLDLKTYSHEGMTKISNAQITILPDQGLAISVLSNTNSGPFYSIASQLTKDIVAEIEGKEDGGKVLWEYLIRVFIGLLTLKMLYDLVVYSRRWIRQGRPTTFRLQAKKIPAYIFDVIPLLVLILLPKMIHTPISMLLRIMPDIGWAIVLGGIIAVFQLFFKFVLMESKKENT